jgi:hypothetical protein
MRQIVCVLQVPADDLPEPELADGLDGDEILENMAGYILEQPSFAAPRGLVNAWGYLVIMTNLFDGPKMGMDIPVQQPFNGVHPKTLQLQPIGRLVPVAAGQSKPDAPTDVPSLRPVQGGQSYRITSPLARGLVTPELAQALETAFGHFARERGFTLEKPLEIQLSRGFKAGSHGHGEGRAADIVAVGDKSLMEWKQEWDQAMAAAEKLSDPQQRVEAIAAEQKRNLGYGLYKALQEHGGWRVSPNGWRPYRGVMQLFGPWTATEGPWKAMPIKDPNFYQRQRLADQQWVFRAHQDHIHVAR